MSQISAMKKNENIFSLCRLRKDCYYAPISVDFSPILRPSQTYQSILPTFNHDQLFYTPAFVNPYQRSLIKSPSESSQNHYQEKFFKKIEANLSRPSENNPFFNPKDDLFCSICGIAFDDYWKHIGSSYHHRKVKASVGDRYIRSLCKPIHQLARSNKREKIEKTCDEPKKGKKIKKQEIQKRCSRKNQKANNQDLIIKLPKDLFEREERAQYFNLSTNGVTSLNPKP